MPSLHAAFTMLVASSSLEPPMPWRRARPLVLLYPAAMALTLMATGEHYFFDILLGWVYAGATMLAWSAWERRRAARAARAGAPEAARARTNFIVSLYEPVLRRSDAEAIDLVASTLLGRAARLTRLLMRSGAHELSRTEVGVLATLTDGPRRITELAATEALAQPTVTQLVDKLEGRGLVVRGRSGEDGRVVLVEITAAERPRALEELRAEIRANMREALVDLPDAELTELAHAADTLGGLIEKLQPDRDA